MYTTVTTKDIKLELVEAKRRTRNRRTEKQLSDGLIYDDDDGDSTIMMYGTRTKTSKLKV